MYFIHHRAQNRIQHNKPKTNLHSTTTTTTTQAFSSMFFYVNTRSWAYQQRCLTDPIQSSAIGAIVFSAIDVFQGLPYKHALSPKSLGEFSFVSFRSVSFRFVSFRLACLYLCVVSVVVVVGEGLVLVFCFSSARNRESGCVFRVSNATAVFPLFAFSPFFF